MVCLFLPLLPPIQKSHSCGLQRKTHRGEAHFPFFRKLNVLSVLSHGASAFTLRPKPFRGCRSPWKSFPTCCIVRGLPDRGQWFLPVYMWVERGRGATPEQSRTTAGGRPGDSWGLWVRSCWPARSWGLCRPISIKALKIEKVTAS